MTKYKFGRPKKKDIDLEKTNEFLQSIGFKSENLTQEWRHMLAFGKYQGKEAVFKLASTQVVSCSTQNEYYWNEAVHSTPEGSRNHFTVPQNFASGLCGKLFYFIAQKFLGDPFIQKSSPDLSLISSKIREIAVATFELENLPINPQSRFVKNQYKKKPALIGDKLLASSTEWASRVPQNLEKFLEIVAQSKDGLRVCVGHGDFVARQLYEVDGKIGIIDGEHAGIRGPLYYDVAQFYIRLRNDHNAKGLAHQYLLEFQKLLSPANKKIFWAELKPVLIQRYLGDLWGAAKNPQKLQELKPLGQEILKDEII